MTILFILFLIFLLPSFNKEFYKTDDPFFNIFKIKDDIICKSVNGYEFEEAFFKKIYINENNIGILHFVNDNELVFRIIDINKSNEKVFNVNIEYFNPKELRGNLFLYAFSSEFLVMYVDKKLFVGKISSRIINLKFIMNLEKYIYYLKVFDNRAYLGTYGIRGDANGYEFNSFLYIVDLNNFSLKNVDLGIPKGFYFTLFNPPEVFDVSSKYIAHSDISTYNINIFDNDGRFLININRGDTLFREMDLHLHQKFSNLIMDTTITLKSALDTMRSTFFSGIGIIEKVNFINDSTLLVRWYGPKTDTTRWYPDIYYDIWEIRNETPILVAKNILARVPSDSTLKQFRPLYSSRYECGSNYIISFGSTYCKEKGSKIETLKQYYERQRECSKENEPILGLTIYEFVK
ncbi:hypothetical protein [Caldisericum sp.]|uniref:hypothetical protein n=1 Tax=Caldisericum sp. TaxID=2499687 RepID=UPI003D10D3FA